MLDAHLQMGCLDRAQAGRVEQLGQVSLSGTGQLGFAFHAGVELAHCVPIRTERPAPAGVIPDGSRYDAARARHSRHLLEPGNRIGHEVNDELGQSCIELVVGKRQVLRRCTFDPNSRMTLASRHDERLRGIDGCDAVCTEPLHKLRRQRAGAAADVEHALAGDHVGEVREQRSERNGVPAHEAVVRVCGDREAHRRNLRVGGCEPPPRPALT